MEVALDLKAWREAHPQLHTHLSVGVPPAKALRSFGLSAWSRGEPALAASVLRAAAALTPDNSAVWADLSGVLYACAMPSEALASLLISLDRDGDQPSRWLSLAALHREAGQDGEAEQAFLNAIRLDPALSEAWVGLGILYFQRRLFPQAVEALRRAIELGSANAAVHACLGKSLYLQGDVAGAAAAYAVQVKVGPKEPRILQKYAFLRFLEALIQGTLPEALRVHAAIVGEEPPERGRSLIGQAFHALSGYGYREAAIRCGEAQLALAPHDPVSRYLVAALAGAAVARAPDDYLIRTFDQFAESFDHKLVDVLDYRIPQKMRDALGETDGAFANILDAGCGTGLAGPLLRAPGRLLTGVDISSGMLAKARERAVYDRLVEAEIHQFLLKTDARYDLIFAADMLVYIGDLRPLLERSAQSLEPRGVLAFSVETAQDAGYLLRASGRFAHSARYVGEVSRDLFQVERAMETQIRLDVKGAAEGMIFILRRREG